jgi:hypothetical protein
MIISQGESCTIPAGYANATVTNQDANKAGSYDIAGDGIAINKQIPGGRTQNTPIHQNEVTVINSGKPDLDVADCQ